MSVTINLSCNCKESSLHILETGDTFLFKDELYQVKGRGVKAPGMPSDFIVVTDLKTGKSERLSMFTRIEPVDIEITVVRK